MSEAARSDSGSAVAGRHSSAEVYDDGHLRVEHDNYYVSCAGEPLKFRRAEFLLLSRLARGAARIVKAEELWGHAWGRGQALQRREPARPRLPPASQARPLRRPHRDDGQRRLPPPARLGSFGAPLGLSPRAAYC